MKYPPRVKAVGALPPRSCLVTRAAAGTLASPFRKRGPRRLGVRVGSQQLLAELRTSSGRGGTPCSSDGTLTPRLSSSAAIGRSGRTILRGCKHPAPLALCGYLLLL
jgi:hypothetical protein